MKCKKFLLAFVSVLLVLTTTAGLFGCAVRVSAEDLMEGFVGKGPGVTEIPGEGASGVTDFAVRLLQQCVAEGKNTLLSPLSVLAALSMTANGAENGTKTEMEDVLGSDVDGLNAFFCAYTNSLAGEGKSGLSLANSIWFKSENGFEVKKDFLQKNADFYGAAAYKAPFDDSTLSDINGWVNKNTDGMIPKILDEIPKDAVMYLINALSFDAEWETIYKMKNQIREGTFTLEDGKEQTAEFMCSKESRYLDDGKATGFIKYYSGRRFAFAALLPNEGVTVGEYVASLDGETLGKMIRSPLEESVEVLLPKFETEYDAELSKTLTEMGMTSAFDPSGADFTGIGTLRGANLYISRVIHKTFISVGEKGTRAGAATAVEMAKNSSAPMERTVFLNRPFVYMLIDTEAGIPLFIGTMMNVAG